jgi:hypothetical protein
MTPAESKMRILAEWRTWIGHRQAADSERAEEVSVFFGEIEANRPDLLSFETKGDKLDVVTSWLTDAGLIK